SHGRRSTRAGEHSPLLSLRWLYSRAPIGAEGGSGRPPARRRRVMKTTAAVLYEVKKPLVVEEVDVLDPGPGEVLVQWRANGFCHSDLHVVTGDYPHPLPVVLGHEAAGVVERVGTAVTTVKPGDHVCSSYIPSCGRCWYCMAGGQPTMCALRDKPRWFMFDGTARFARKGT